MSGAMSTALAGEAQPSADLHYARLAALALAAITVLRLLWLAGGSTDLFPDEAQYWLWSRTPALGYYSKPPLIAWIIAATTFLFGDGEFGVRAASPLLHLGTACVVFAIARRLYDPRTACWAAIAYATLPGVSVSAGIISTDVPLLLCWAAALYGFVRAREEGAGPGWWALVGAAAGLGLLAKYAMAYWLLSALVYLAVVRAERRHMPRFLAAAALAIVLYSPNFFWNLAHGFVSYAHTRDNAHIGGSLIHPLQFLEFFGAQFGVFGPIFFAALVVLALGFRRLVVDRRDRMLAAFALPTLLMMLAVSFLSRAHANWSAPAYVSAVILVVAWLLRQEPRGRLVAASVALHVVAAAILLNPQPLARAAGIHLSERYDPLRRLQGWSELGDAVQMLRAQHPGAVLASEDRELLAALIYYMRPHPFGAVKWNPDGLVTDHFALTTDLDRHIGADVLLITGNGRFAASGSAYFAEVRALGPVRADGAAQRRTYFAYLGHDFRGYRAAAEGAAR
jgi:hypothetical protein